MKKPGSVIGIPSVFIIMQTIKTREATNTKSATLLYLFVVPDYPDTNCKELNVALQS